MSFRSEIIICPKRDWQSIFLIVFPHIFNLVLGLTSELHSFIQNIGCRVIRSPLSCNINTVCTVRAFGQGATVA